MTELRKAGFEQSDDRILGTEDFQNDGGEVKK